MIKTYDRVDPSRTAMTFAMKRMEDIYADHGGVPDAAHRHDYYTVLLVEEARGIHQVDFQEFPLQGGEIFFLAPGQVHRIIEEVPSRGCVMSFSPQFLLENHIPERFITDINLFRAHGDTPPLVPQADTWDALRGMANAMYAAFTGQSPMRMQVVGTYLKLFLLTSNEACRLDPERQADASQADQLVGGFKTLVDQHFEHEHQVAFYADRLHVTADHLNRTVKASTGKSAKQWIQARVTVAAKRLLLFTAFSAKEIGYELGFADPAHFSNFFKRQTGDSPAAFRTRYGEQKTAG